MSKNEQYAGVDDKYIPEEEKNDSGKDDFRNEVKNDMHNVYKGIKSEFSGKNDQEKMQNIGKTGVKIAKGYLIFKIALIAFVVIFFILTFIFILSSFFTTNRIIDESISSFGQIYNQATAGVDNTSDKIQAGAFNARMETHVGTQYGLSVSRLLDVVTENTKKYSDHPIIVVYGSASTSDTNEITAIKKKIDRSAQYEVSLDYDSHGYINKVTIAED